MARFTARMILTTLDGSQSNTMVLKSTLATNITTRETMARTIPRMPEMRDPVLSDWHRQHDCTIGPAIVTIYIDGTPAGKIRMGQHVAL